MHEAFIVAAGSWQRTDADLDDPARTLHARVLSQSGLAEKRIEACIWGGPGEVGELWVPALAPRIAVQSGFCSAQQAVHLAVQAILAGDQDAILAGGADDGSQPDPDGVNSLAQRTQAWIEAGIGLRDQLLTFEERYFRSITAPTSKGPDQAPRSTVAGCLPLTAGAAWIVLASERLVGSLNLAPRARLAGRAMTPNRSPAGWDGMQTATQLALSRAEIQPEDLGVVCLCTPFLGAVLDWLGAFHLDEDLLLRLPSLPGSASGAMGIAQVITALENRSLSYGLVVSSGLDGWASAAMVERV